MKPSYEELEEQLNRSRRLCDAALANERAWETAMMQACGEDGPKSVADKFAELKAKCAALSAEKEKFAVECAATKTAIAYLKSGRQDFSLNTPATDAFLAEVRAQGVEMFAECAYTLEHHDHAVAFAAELRKGGNQ
ncbi:hypothetical protein [Escherichia coli]|uniref:hypothetical protein n=1 Tax=Escherichia coli TaxID=562 RepID=UPI001BC9AACA|nr:hypothetical protein [Escherichia coli]